MNRKSLTVNRNQKKRRYPIVLAILILLICGSALNAVEPMREDGWYRSEAVLLVYAEPDAERCGVIVDLWHADYAPNSVLWSGECKDRKIRNGKKKVRMNVAEGPGELVFVRDGEVIAEFSGELKKGRFESSFGELSLRSGQSIAGPWKEGRLADTGVFVAFTFEELIGYVNRVGCNKGKFYSSSPGDLNFSFDVYGDTVKLPDIPSYKKRLRARADYDREKAAAWAIGAAGLIALLKGTSWAGNGAYSTLGSQTHPDQEESGCSFKITEDRIAANGRRRISYRCLGTSSKSGTIEQQDSGSWFAWYLMSGAFRGKTATEALSVVCGCS